MKKLLKKNIDVIGSLVMITVLIIGGITLLNLRFKKLNQIKDTDSNSYKMSVSTPIR